jgi:hypothetical protein
VRGASNRIPRRHSRSGKDVEPPLLLASGSSRNGTRPIPARSTTMSCSQELPMPAQQGLGRDEETAPPPSWEQPAECREYRSVRGPVADAAMELTLQHPDLVAEHHQLDACPKLFAGRISAGRRSGTRRGSKGGGAWQMMLDGAEECQLSGPIGELVPFSMRHSGSLRGSAWSQHGQQTTR